jgi:3-hydroxyisobutyrate dehydrogenase-like beta-hydroxyacid dehydrogenase
MTTTACFIGLGSMGSNMASNLIKNGVKLYVWNRSKEKAAKLVKEGAQLLDSPRDAFDKSQIIFSMVADDHALQEICDGDNGILKNSKPGSIHVSMSTVSPKISRSLAAKHQEKGVAYVAAPVFGRPDAAEQQNLWICAAGDPKAKEQVKPLLLFMGKKVADFGEDHGNANEVKLTGNFLILSLIESLSEAYAFAEKSGVSLPDLHSFFAETLFPSPVFQNYGRLIIDRRFDPAGFKMQLGLKDIDLLLRSAENIRVPLPIAGLLHDRLLAGLANDRGSMDWSAITITELEEAGLATKK